MPTKTERKKIKAIVNRATRQIKKIATREIKVNASIKNKKK